MEYDSIYTTMINFQDVIKQESQDYGSLWCDEGVYRLAKEIQFLKSDQFNNLFLGLGGFHFEKIVYGCVGSFLEPSGISSILVELECFGSSVIDSVMGGKDYVRSKKGLSSINEAILNLMFCEFMSSSEYSEVVKMPVVGDLISFVITMNHGRNAEMSFHVSKLLSINLLKEDVPKVKTSDNGIPLWQRFF